MPSSAVASTSTPGWTSTCMAGGSTLAVRCTSNRSNGGGAPRNCFLDWGGRGGPLPRPGGGGDELGGGPRLGRFDDAGGPAAPPRHDAPVTVLDDHVALR